MTDPFVRAEADMALFRSLGASVGEVADGVIWRPGAPTSGNVVATWQDVQVRVDAVQGALTVYCDPSLQPCVIPPGIWQGYGSARLAPFNNATGFVVSVADGGVLVDYLSLRNMVLLCACTTTPALKFSPDFEFILHDFGVIAIDVGATVPAIRMASTDDELTIILRTGLLDNSRAPGVAVVQAAVGPLALIIYAQCAAPNFPALFTGNEIGGPVGSQVFWENDASVPALTSALFLGTLQAEPTALAPSVTYTPATPPDWPTPPTQVAQALDELATRPSSYAFVYRPGGVAGSNVYTTWPALMAALALVSGPKLVEIDASLAGGTATVPAGAWNLNDCTLVSFNGTDILSFDDGATIVAQQWSASNALAITHTSTAPVWEVTQQEQLLTLSDSVVLYATGAVPFIHVTATGFLDLTLSVNAGVGDHAHAAISADAGGTAFVFAVSGGALNPNATAGAGALQPFIGADATLGTPQGLAGATHPLGKAGQVGYTASVPANWSGVSPANVKDALDRIAAKIGPIP